MAGRALAGGDAPHVAPDAYQRLVLNEFASAELQFVDMSAWDNCVQPSLTPTLERIPIYVGVDASVQA